MAAVNPCDPALAPVRCWEHEDCLEHPELALACADGREAEWTVMDVGFDLYPDTRDGDVRYSHDDGLWIFGVGDGDWPGEGNGADCAFPDGDGDGCGLGGDAFGEKGGDGYGSKDVYSDTAHCGWQP